MGLLIKLVGDIFIVRYLVWRPFKMFTEPHKKMFETESDYKGRRIGAAIIIFIGLAAVVANHVAFGNIDF